MVAYVVANVLQYFLRTPERTDLQAFTMPGLMMAAVIIGPLIETLIFQCLLIELGAAFRFRRFFQFIVSIIPFAVAHRFAGAPTVVAAGIIAGFSFAYTYIKWRTESLVTAILMTFLLHASFNLVGVVGIFFLPL